MALPLDELGDDRRARVDVTVHQVTAEPIAQFEREFDVDGIARAQEIEARPHDALGHHVERHRGRVEGNDGETHAVDRDRIFFGDAFGDGVGRLDREHDAVAEVAADRLDAAEMSDEAAKHAAAGRLS